jgi:hypothetical protein
LEELDALQDYWTKIEGLLGNY